MAHTVLLRAVPTYAAAGLMYGEGSQTHGIYVVPLVSTLYLNRLTKV